MENTKQLLDRDKNGAVYRTIDNYLLILNHDPSINKRIQFNEMAEAIEKTNRDKTKSMWTDADDSSLMHYIEYNYHLRSRACYDDAFAIFVNKNRYNPAQNLVKSIKWDGQPRIRKMLSKWLNVQDEPYTDEVSRLIFHGGISRLFNPAVKFDIMPILIGSQGCGKSTFIRWLALDDNFFKEGTHIDGNQAIEQLESGWIVEMSELLAFAKTREIETIKSYISRQYDSYRRPYQRRVSKNPRKVIFIGSTNKNEFLTDKTGNRRFYPVVTRGNTELADFIFNHEAEIKHDIQQCWAEAYHDYKTKTIKLIAKEQVMQVATERQNEVSEDDWREGMIADYLEKNNEVCVKQLWEEALGYDKYKDCTKKDSSDLVAIMKKFTHFERINTPRKTAKYGQQRVWKRLPKTLKQLNLVPIDDENLDF